MPFKLDKFKERINCKTDGEALVKAINLGLILPSLQEIIDVLSIQNMNLEGIRSFIGNILDSDHEALDAFVEKKAEIKVQTLEILKNNDFASSLGKAPDLSQENIENRIKQIKSQFKKEYLRIFRKDLKDFLTLLDSISRSHKSVSG